MEKTVVFDVDGCLSDFVKGFTELGNKMFGIPVMEAHRQETWDNFGGTKEQKSAIWEVLKKDPEYWLSLSPLVNPVTFARIDSLALQGARVYFLTTRVGVKVKQQTERWLVLNGVYNPAVIISGLHDKGEICKYLRATHAIEDKVENALLIARSGAKSYLLDRPYNRVELPVEVDRITSIDQFLDEVNNG